MRRLLRAGETLSLGAMALLGALCAGCASMPAHSGMESRAAPSTTRHAERTPALRRPPASSTPAAVKPDPAASQRQQDPAPELKPTPSDPKPIEFDQDSYERHPAKWREKLRARYT